MSNSCPIWRCCDPRRWRLPVARIGRIRRAAPCGRAARGRTAAAAREITPGPARARRVPLGRGVARRPVQGGVGRRARARSARASAGRMPETRRALDEGDVSMSAVRGWSRFGTPMSDAFERCEPQFVEAAGSIGERAPTRRGVLARGGRTRGVRGPAHAHGGCSVGLAARDGAGRRRSRSPRPASRCSRRCARCWTPSAFGCRGRSDAGAETRRRARRDLSSMARPRRATDRRRRTPARHVTVDADTLRASAGDGAGERSQRAGGFRCGAAARLRRLGHAGLCRGVRSRRRRAPNAGRPTLDPQGRDRSGPGVPVPRLRSSAHVVRRAPRVHWADGGPTRSPT